jgi:GNAT superfamily N-acetyltransferase
VKAEASLFAMKRIVEKSVHRDDPRTGRAHSSPPPRATRSSITSESELPLNLVFGGRAMVLRWLRADDTGRLIEFFASHTLETIHQRYGYIFTRMTPEHAERLVNVDPHRDVALGLFEHEQQCWRIVAIGRYCLSADGRAAELAFVVREDRRRLHIASTLLDVLIAIARERGLEKLFAQVQVDNGPMLAVFRAARAQLATDEASGVVTMTLPLIDSLVKSRAQPDR